LHSDVFLQVATGRESFASPVSRTTRMLSSSSHSANSREGATASRDQGVQAFGRLNVNKPPSPCPPHRHFLEKDEVPESPAFSCGIPTSCLLRPDRSMEERSQPLGIWFHGIPLSERNHPDAEHTLGQDVSHESRSCRPRWSSRGYEGSLLRCGVLHRRWSDELVRTGRRACLRPEAARAQR